MLFALLTAAFQLGGRHKSSKPPATFARLRKLALPRVEALEDRLCPAGVWGPDAAGRDLTVPGLQLVRSAQLAP